VFNKILIILLSYVSMLLRFVSELVNKHEYIYRNYHLYPLLCMQYWLPMCIVQLPKLPGCYNFRADYCRPSSCKCDSTVFLTRNTLLCLHLSSSSTVFFSVLLSCVLVNFGRRAISNYLKMASNVGIYYES